MLTCIERIEYSKATTVVYTQQYPLTLPMVGIGQMSRHNAPCLPILYYCILLLFCIFTSLFLYPCKQRFLAVYKNHPICLTVHISHKRRSFYKNEPILMKLDSVVVYNLRMCMKGDNPGLNNIKEDNCMLGMGDSL